MSQGKSPDNIVSSGMIEAGSPMWWPRYIREGLWSGKQIRQMLSPGSSGIFSTFFFFVHSPISGQVAITLEKERARCLQSYQGLRLRFSLVLSLLITSHWKPWYGIKDLKLLSGNWRWWDNYKSSYASCVNAFKSDSDLSVKKRQN